MVREHVEVRIEGGRTVFRTVREELPLFQQTGDLTETLGQYAGTISVDKDRKPAEVKTETVPQTGSINGPAY